MTQEKISIKPELPKYVPYGSAEEFLEAQKEHGPYLYRSETKLAYYMPTMIDNNGIYIHTVYYYNYCSYNDLVNKFCWQDGTPCGKLKEE